MIYPQVYSGTLIVQGQGIARVTATGAHTEIGKIGKSLQALHPRIQPFTATNPAHDVELRHYDLA